MEEMPAEVQQALKIPKNDLGRFVLVQLLGRGGMGEVYRAWEKKLGRFVAVKFIRGTDPEDLQRFTREAQIVARLNHPNIAPVYELSEHDGTPFIVMQYINGVTIDRATLDLRGKLRAIRDAAAALDFAHRQGIVHRDVKPANIMLEGDHVYVMDFGLARQTVVDSSISHTGVLLGTPSFMSPEQARGRHKLVDARTDVYGLGAALYAIIARHLPFFQLPDEDVMGLLHRVVEDDPPPLDAPAEVQ
jgi:serine/threonine-protein kinase